MLKGIIFHAMAQRNFISLSDSPHVNFVDAPLSSGEERGKFAIVNWGEFGNVNRQRCPTPSIIKPNTFLLILIRLPIH
jgi:hypothetical protein